VPPASNSTLTPLPARSAIHSRALSRDAADDEEIDSVAQQDPE
jgi:hypothetical protein